MSSVLFTSRYISGDATTICASHSSSWDNCTKMTATDKGRSFDSWISLKTMGLKMERIGINHCSSPSDKNEEESSAVAWKDIAESYSRNVCSLYTPSQLITRAVRTKMPIFARWGKCDQNPTDIITLRIHNLYVRRTRVTDHCLLPSLAIKVRKHIYG